MSEIRTEVSFCPSEQGGPFVSEENLGVQLLFLFHSITNPSSTYTHTHTQLSKTLNFALTLLLSPYTISSALHDSSALTHET